MTEAQIQTALVGYCRAVLPHGMVFAVPNGSRRTAGGRASNGVAGLTKGVSDLVVLAPGKIIFAEVKNAKGVVSPEQREFGQSVQTLGHHFAIWRGIEDARNTFAALGVKTREVINPVGESA